MGKEKPTQKPTRDETAINLLRLGHLLHRFSYPTGPLGLTRTLKPEEAERLKAEIASVSGLVESSVNDSRQWLLRGVFGLRGREAVDPLAVRIVAFIAWASLGSERPDTGVARVANAVATGDWGTHLEARRTIRLMIARETAIGIREAECVGESLFPNSRLIRFLSGEGNLPVLFSAKSVREEREEWEQRRQQEVLRKVKPAPRRDEPFPPSEPSIEPQCLLTAKGIYESLKDQVIALDGPLRRFSAQMSLHMRRLEQIRKGVRPTVGPIVTLLIGSSGSGKTWMAENFARASGLPYAISDMTSVSQSSYVGLSLDECFYGLLANKTKPSEAQKGIVVLDEFDKVCAKSDGHSTSDPQGRGIQAELLKPLEGCKLPLGSRRSNTPFIGTLDTYETNFICAGAFEFLHEMLADSNRKAAGMGFGSAGAKTARGDIRDALVKYGFLEQIINRIGAVILLPDPTPEQIVRITCHPGTGLLARQNSFLGSFGMRLAPTEEALRHLAGWACETRGYSRSVKNVLGTLVEGHLMDDDSKGVIEVSLEDVRRVIGETENANI